jgi:zinc/manganese transport system permease protein
LLANNPHGGEHLKDLLVGQILWVNGSQLVLMGGLTAVLAGLWFALGRRLGSLGFYVIFAMAVTASVQLVGVYLVFASLIIPALATRGLTGRARLAAAYFIGVVGYALGLACSALFDLPSGAVVVLVMAVVAILGSVRWGVKAKRPVDTEPEPVTGTMVRAELID